MPTFFRSATLAMLPTMVRNTIGPISISIESTKLVPMGSMAMPKVGASQPTRMPKTMAGQYREVQLLVPACLGAAFLAAAALPAVVM